jgi:hypothetical protein
MFLETVSMTSFLANSALSCSLHIVSLDNLVAETYMTLLSLVVALRAVIQVPQE